MKKLTLDNKKDNFLNTMNFREKLKIDNHCNVKLVLSAN